MALPQQPFPLYIGSAADQTTCSTIFPLYNRYFCTVIKGVRCAPFFGKFPNIIALSLLNRRTGTTVAVFVKRMVWISSFHTQMAMNKKPEMNY